MKQKPFSYIRANLSDVIKQVNQIGEPIAVSRYGQPEAVLSSYNDYQNQQRQSFLTNWKAWHQEARDVLIDEPFCPDRQLDKGRDFSW